MTTARGRWAQLVLVLALLVGASGVAAAVAVDPADDDVEDVAVPSSTTRSTRSSTTTTVVPTTTTALVAGSTTTTRAPRVTSAVTTEPARGTTAPDPVRPTTPGPVPQHLARVLVQNEMDLPLDVSINVGFLRMAPHASVEVLVAAQLDASGDQVPPGSDLITVSIPPAMGLPDEGCGSSTLGQQLDPGGDHLMRIFGSGTCQLLGGSAKPTFRVTRR